MFTFATETRDNQTIIDGLLQLSARFFTRPVYIAQLLLTRDHHQPSSPIQRRDIPRHLPTSKPLCPPTSTPKSTKSTEVSPIPPPRITPTPKTTNPIPPRKDLTKIRHNDTYPAIDPSTKSNHANHAVFITGASKGFGRATAIAYAAAGASHIALGARSSYGTLEQEILTAAEKAGKPAPRVLALTVDVQDLASVEAAAKEIEKEFGRLDILVNNAGYLESFTPVKDSDPKEWWTTYEVNVRGVYYVTRACLPLLLRGGEKTVLNVTSAGANAIYDGASGYQVTKLAVVRFTEFLCREYASQGLIAYSVHPGGVLTELGLNMPKHAHGSEFAPIFFASCSGRSADGRDAVLNDTVEMGADTMVFLTQERRVWLAGRYIDCAWDMPELMSRAEEIVKGDKLKTRMVV